MKEQEIKGILHEYGSERICIEADSMAGRLKEDYSALVARETNQAVDQILACFQDDYMDEPLTDVEREIVKQEWEKAHAIELALKEQMERVIERIDKSYLYLKSVCLAAEDNGELARGYDLAMNEALSELVNLKSQLESE